MQVILCPTRATGDSCNIQTMAFINICIGNQCYRGVRKHDIVSMITSIDILYTMSLSKKKKAKPGTNMLKGKNNIMFRDCKTKQ